MPEEEIAVEDGYPVTIQGARKAEYVVGNYRLVTCVMCHTYCEGVPFYYNEDGEVVCYECIEVPDDE